jgi:hypothetical protein
MLSLSFNKPINLTKEREESYSRNTMIKKIYYELNPPKIVIGDYFDAMRLNQELQILLNRSSELINLVNGGIHLTDSVLGIPRVSSVTAANYIKKCKRW